MSRRLLEVFIDEEHVGQLRENAGIWSFQYSENWLRQGYPLSPGLPLRSDETQDEGTRRPVQWFFDNLLPEEMARTRLIASLEKGDWDSWRLLERFGGESAGALTLLPPGASLGEPGARALPDEELQARILALPHIPLGATAPKKMSLAGAQEKLPVLLDEHGQLFEPLGAQISTHILKPDALSEFYPASAVNEWFCARVAQEMGLPVPPVMLRHLPATVYLIERFDRVQIGKRKFRRHTLDAAQLLSLSAGAKYVMSGAKALADVVALCRAKAVTRIALFRWTVFNVLVGNGDAHLKNLSVFAGRDGYALAPHYDLVSTAAWARPELLPHSPTWPNVELSFPLGQASAFSELRREHLYAFAEELALPRMTAERELVRLCGGIAEAADKIIAEYEALPVPSAVRARELRMLRAIRHLPIATLIRQL